MVVPKDRPKKDRTRKNPLPKDFKPIEDVELIPKAGRTKESYRADRRNLFRPLENSEKSIIVRSVNPSYSRIGEYQKVYTVTHPEFIRKISDRGEVHYEQEK
jgi:hypothetical protein